MIRSSIAFICLAVAFALVPAASAAEFPSTKSPLFAVSDNYVYWVKDRPKGCRGCNQLWRTGLKDGISSAALPAKKGEIIRLLAAGQKIAFTEARETKSKYMTRVQIVDEAGGGGAVATGIYHQKQKKKCGTIVGAGAFAPDSEFAWQRVNVEKGSGSCRFVGRRILRGVFKTRIDGSVGTLVPTHSTEAVGGFFHEELSGNGQILGYDGTHLLMVEGQLQPLKALQIGTASRVIYLPPLDFEETEFDGVLGPTGAVATAFAPEESDDYSEVLFPSAMDAESAIVVSARGTFVSDRQFCGADLFQVVMVKGTATVVRRNLTGTIVSSKQLKLSKAPVWPELACNATTGLIHYTRVSPSGRVISEPALAFELP